MVAPQLTPANRNLRLVNLADVSTVFVRMKELCHFITFFFISTSPADQDRGLCQPPEEPPALQLVGGSLCPPQTKLIGQSPAERQSQRAD